MDLLSVTASIIAILQLTTEVIKYLNDVEDAPKDGVLFVIEASNLYNLLVSLRYRLEEGISNEAWYNEVISLGIQDGPLDQYKHALEKIQLKVLGGKGLAKMGNALLWDFNKEEIACILSRIERLKSLVQIALQMDHFKLSQDIKKYIGSIHSDNQAMKNDMSFVRNKIPVLQDGVDGLQIGVDKLQLGRPPLPGSPNSTYNQPGIESAGYIASPDWETYHQIIAEHYMDDGMPLAELMKYMKSIHYFSATIDQWKRQLSKWEMRRYLNASDAAHILRLYREAEDQGLQRTVECSKLKRSRESITLYIKRSKKFDSEAELLSSIGNESTPPYIVFHDISIQPQTPLRTYHFSLEASGPPPNPTASLVQLNELTRSRIWTPGQSPVPSISQGAEREQSVTTGATLEYCFADVQITPAEQVPNLSMAETLKICCETLLGEPISWWPLGPKVTRCPPGCSRVSWTCVCGSRLYFDVPDHQAEDLGRLLGPRNFAQNATGPILPLYNNPGSRTSAQVSISNLTASTGAASNANMAEYGLNSLTSSPDNVTIGCQHPSSRLESTDQGYIHWCVDENKTMTRIVDLDTKALCVDTLIGTMLDTYSKIRGWRNLWDLSVCSDVAFIKFGCVDSKDAVACIGESLPPKSDKEYVYDSFEPLELFEGCLRTVLRHGLAKGKICTDPASPVFALQQLPRKVPVRLDRKLYAPGYGLYAVSARCYWKMAVLSVLLLIVAAVFAICWLLWHPGDLQNAFLICIMILAFLSYFRPSTRIEQAWRIKVD